jgi:hypothetical protein
MGTPTNPDVGDRVFDGGEFIYLKDVKPKELIGLRTAQEGLDGVLGEIFANQTDWGGKAGIHPDEYNDLVTTTERITRINKFLAPVAKFLEMMEETRAILEDKRQRIVFNVASSVDRREKETPGLQAKYEKTRAYRSASARKAVKTRMKNAEAEAEEAEATEATQGAPAPVQPQAQ